MSKVDKKWLFLCSVKKLIKKHYLCKAKKRKSKIINKHTKLSIEYATKKEIDLLTLKAAAAWASEYLGKTVTTSNISYLVQYGRIEKKGNGATLISKIDLENYYNSYKGQREIEWKDKLGNDLNWALSFDNLREADTTKHVHRLHHTKENSFLN